MAYDEIYDGDVIRPLYRKYLLEDSRRTDSQRTHALRVARKTVHGDAQFTPLVRLMTDRDYRRLQAGVRQRGRALRMFLIDHYFGGRSYVAAGILTKFEIDKIQSRYDSLPNQVTLRPENIQFWYAPDTVRDESGEFRVIEDNVGFVGGMGDLEAFAEAIDVLGARIPKTRHPFLFYRDMVELYAKEARRSGGGKTILLSYPRSQRLNHEDERLERILKDLYVTPITNLRTLTVREEGLFHLGERVGFVIINMNLEDIDPAGSSPDRVSNFWRAVSKGHLGVSYAPGLEFVGDKKFCPSVEALIGYYLGEKCILPSLPTVRFESARASQRVRAQRQQWVIKLCRGQSGKSVWVGPHVTPQIWAKLLNRVVKRPGDFVAQKYCEPSQFLGHAVDLRPLAIISKHGEQVSPIPWGRAAKDGKSKTNIASGGLLSPVAVISKP